MKNQSGRSMIEMLGVLAIIGVLSLGSVAVFNAAMNRHTANNLTYDVMLMAESTLSLGPQEQMPFDASTEYNQMSSVRDANGIVNVTVQDVENDICEVLLSKAGNDVFEFRDAGGNALDACEDDTTDVVFAFTGNGLDGNNPENAECIPGCDPGHECNQGQCCPTDETCQAADNNPNMIAKECLCECNLNCTDGKVSDLTCTTCVCEDGKTGEMCDKNCPAVGETTYIGDMTEEECLACPDVFWDNYSESCTHCATTSYCPVFNNQSDAESCVAACADSEYERQWVKSETNYEEFLCLPVDETSCPDIAESAYMTKSDCYECENTYWHEGVCRGCGAELYSEYRGNSEYLPYSTYDEMIENLNRCDQYLSYTFMSGSEGGDLFLATNRECPDINESQDGVPLEFCYQCPNAIPGDAGVCAGCGSYAGLIVLSESMEQQNVQKCQQAGYQWTCNGGFCEPLTEE